ncbi:hypothetical protein M9458_048171, partial [Cirrhinus mrigala]
PTLDPEPSPPSSHCVEQNPEPPVDGEPMPATINEASLRKATELEIALESEPHGLSDQVCEPATALATWEIAHCTISEGELSSMNYVLPVPPSNYRGRCCLPLPPPLHQSSPSPPLPPSVQWDCQFPLASWLENPLFPPPACRPRGSTILSVHHLRWAPLSPRLHLGQSSTICHLGTTLLWLRLVPQALSGFSLPSTPPPSSVTPASHSRPSGSLPQSLEPTAPPWPSGFSVSPWLIGYPPTCSAAITLPPWLLPLSAPLWVAFMTVAWVPPGPSCSSLHQIHLGSSFFSMAPPSIRHLGTPLLWLHLIPPALSGTSLPPAPPQSSVTPASPQPSGSLPPPRPPEPSSLPWPSGFLVSPWLFGSSSPPWRLLHSHLLCCHHPSSTMAPPSVGSTVGRLYGYGLGPSWTLLLQVPPVYSLAPPSI